MKKQSKSSESENKIDPTIPKELLGVWVTDPSDKRSLDKFGQQTWEFLPGGKLRYKVVGKKGWFETTFTFRVESEWIVVSSENVSAGGRDRYRLEPDGKLSMHSGTQWTRFVREENLRAAKGEEAATKKDESSATAKPVKTPRSKLKMNAEQKREAKRLIGTVTKAEARSHFTTNFGRQHDASGISVIVPAKTAKALVEQLRAVLPSEMLAFVGTHQWLGDETFEGVEVVVGVGTSQFDILRLARTDGANFDWDTEDIIARLMQYDKEYGIRIFHAETDVVEFDLLRTPDDMAAFTADVYTFCPDIIDQGDMSVEQMAGAIEAAGTVYLWWD